MTPKQLKNLRKKLPVGYADKIAAITGYKPDTIYKVLTGKRKNIGIILTAIELAEENVKTENDTRQKLKEIIR